MPIFKAYPETMFGGDFLTEADYRDPFLAELIDAEGWMLWPPIRYHHQTVAWDLPVPAPAPPDRQHWLGTDDQARDVLARAIYGLYGVDSGTMELLGRPWRPRSCLSGTAPTGPLVSPAY